MITYFRFYDALVGNKNFEISLEESVFFTQGHVTFYLICPLNSILYMVVVQGNANIGAGFNFNHGVYYLFQRIVNLNS